MRYSVTGATAEQVKAVGGADVRATRSGSVVFATLTEAQARQLESLGGKVEPVARVGPAVIAPPIISPPAPVEAVPTYSPQQLAWVTGFEQIRRMTVPPLYGEGINVAVVDTGIRAAHQLIGEERIIYRNNYTRDAPGDAFDHGTGVASILLAMAPRCRILDMKVLDSRGLGTEEEVALAIDDCIALRDSEPEVAPRVINLSLGSPDGGNPDEPLRVICREAIQAGIWVVAAAGNAGPAPQSVMSPACERYVAAVGSCKLEPFAVSDFSSRGPTREGLVKPDVAFFGEDIRMASSAGDDATVAKSGTSFAAPFASGIAVLYQEGVLRYGGVEYVEEIPGLYPEIRYLVPVAEVIDKYASGFSAKPQGSLVEKDNDYGYGVPMGSLMVRMFEMGPALDITALVAPLFLMAALGMMLKVAK